MAKEKPQIVKRLYTLKDASLYLGRPVSSIRTLVWSGKLPVIQDGRKMYVDIEDMKSFVENNKLRMV